MQSLTLDGHTMLIMIAGWCRDMKPSVRQCRLLNVADGHGWGTSLQADGCPVVQGIDWMGLTYASL